MMFLLLENNDLLEVWEICFFFLIIIIKNQQKMEHASVKPAQFRYGGVITKTFSTMQLLISLAKKLFCFTYTEYSKRLRKCMRNEINTLCSDVVTFGWETKMIRE